MLSGCVLSCFQHCQILRSVCRLSADPARQRPASEAEQVTAAELACLPTSPSLALFSSVPRPLLCPLSAFARCSSPPPILTPQNELASLAPDLHAHLDRGEPPAERDHSGHVLDQDRAAAVSASCWVRPRRGALPIQRPRAGSPSLELPAPDFLTTADVTCCISVAGYRKTPTSVAFMCPPFAPVNR